MNVSPGITKNRKVLCIGGAAAAVVVAGSLSLMMPKSSGASESRVVRSDACEGRSTATLFPSVVIMQ